MINAFKVTILTMGVFTAGLTGFYIYDSATSKPRHTDPAASEAPEFKEAANVPSYLQRNVHAVDWEGTIFEGAIVKVAPDTLPKLLGKLGNEAAGEANKGLMSAVYRVIRVPACDGVDYASVSDNSTPENLRFFVHCNNGKEWRFSEVELVDNDGEWLTKENAPRADYSYYGWKKVKGPHLAPKAE